MAHSQTSRDRQALTFFIAIPVVVALLMIRRSQTTP